jgi:hypothetical protein
VHESRLRCERSAPPAAVAVPAADAPIARRGRAIALAPSVECVASPCRAVHTRPRPNPRIRQFAQAIAEVLAGARPVGQLEDAVTLEVLAVLARAAGRLGRCAGHPTRRPVVRAIHVDAPSPGVAEAAVVIDTGVRVQAIALRLEADRGRWRCTALALG